MILDLKRFVQEGRPAWDELEVMLRRLEDDPAASLSLEQVKRFHYLYQRASADLARVMTFAAEPEMRAHLENLVGRAYGEIHRQRRGGSRFAPWRWFSHTFPQTFRRRWRAFALAGVALLAGTVFGAGAVMFDEEAKGVLLPFGHGEMDPGERVREEEERRDHSGDRLAEFASELMRHNTQVAILAMSLGMTWGFGTLVITFYNGVILGGVIVDYVAAGESTFLLGWLLPHGSIELPAILIGAQAGLVLGGAMVGWGSRHALHERLRAVGPDLATLIGAAAVLLVWAGIVEAFFSQYHEPLLPYAVKIVFGLAELIGLVAFLSLSGARSHDATGEVRA